MSSTVTVTATKPSDDTTIGIAFKNNLASGELFISTLKPGDGIFASTLLQEGMIVDAICGIDCTKGITSKKAVDILKDAKQGEITIVAHTPTPQQAVAEELVPVPPVTTSSVTITATKPTNDAKLGIGLKTNHENGEVYVSSIKPDGIFAPTLLQVNMVIDKINDTEIISGKMTNADCVTLLKSAKKGNVIIVAHTTRTSSTPVVQATTVVPTSVVVSNLPIAAINGGKVPPNAPIGGTWGKTTYSGKKQTWWHVLDVLS